MELNLTRVYKRGGTNGTLTLNGHFVCFTLELPWKENKRNISCIPEGKYELKASYSNELQNHLEIMDVFEKKKQAHMDYLCFGKDHKGCGQFLCWGTDQ